MPPMASDVLSPRPSRTPLRMDRIKQSSTSPDPDTEVRHTLNVRESVFSFLVL